MLQREGAKKGTIPRFATNRARVSVNHPGCLQGDLQGEHRPIPDSVYRLRSIQSLQDEDVYQVHNRSMKSRTDEGEARI
ncbi:MAG: hypothetical protein CMA97_02975 [Euryarchaeota archaeon]|nr:hypothetical protein [Euryarchaeota archaeon]